MLPALFIVQGLFATEPVTTPGPSSMAWEFKINWHTPRSNCTRLLGICSISFCVTINFAEDSPGSEEVPCTIMLNRDNEMVIRLSESNLSKYDPELLKYFTGKSTVTFDDTYDITEEISKATQPQGRVIIRPGTYPLLYQNGVYTITFPL